MNNMAIPAGTVEPTRFPDSAPETAKVMIVDDDPGTIDVVQFQLGEMGYRDFVACTDAREALQLVVSEEPDVLLLDIVMPEPNGLEILRQIRDSDDLAHLPVIILTAFDDAEMKIRALELGATDFLGKPVNFVELVPRMKLTSGTVTGCRCATIASTSSAACDNRWRAAIT